MPFDSLNETEKRATSAREEFGMEITFQVNSRVLELDVNLHAQGDVVNSESCG